VRVRRKVDKICVDDVGRAVAIDGRQQPGVAEEVEHDAGLGPTGRQSRADHAFVVIATARHLATAAVTAGHRRVGHVSALAAYGSRRQSLDRYLIGYGQLDHTIEPDATERSHELFGLVDGARIAVEHKAVLERFGQLVFDEVQDE